MDITKKNTEKHRKVNKDIKQKKELELWQKVLIGLVLGVLTGYFAGEKAAYLKPLGTIFINLIRMVVIPLVLFSIIFGITSIGNAQGVSRVSGKSLFLFFATSFVAVCLGIGFGLLFKPGAGIDLSSMGDSKMINNHDLPDLSEMIISFIPNNAIGAMAEGNILQVIVFSFFAGITLNLMQKECKSVIKITHELAHLTFKMIEIIVKFAPYGVFGFMAWSVGTQGLDVITSLAKLIMVILSACLLQYIGFGLYILVFTKLNPKQFYKKMIEPQLIAFSTSSSKAALVTTMKTLHDRLGVSTSSTNFVLPIGSSINMIGGAIYLGVTSIFFAQAVGKELELNEILLLMFMCTIGSIGAAGIPSGILLFLGMVLNSVGLPIEGVAIIAAIDRILDMITTTVNVTGDACITLIIDKSEGNIDEDVYNSND